MLASIVSYDSRTHRFLSVSFSASAQAGNRVISDFARRCRGPVLLAGDFNTPGESGIYREYWDDFCNAFSASGWGFGYSYYYGLRCQVRVDHILGGSGWQSRRCWIGPDVGSPHRLVLADLQRTPAAR